MENIVKCKNCNKNDRVYNCPNCKIDICNLNCYKNHNDKKCYEKFCKNNVIGNLKNKKILEKEKKKFKKKINTFRYNDDIEKDILEEKKEKKFLDILQKIEKKDFNILNLEKKDQKDFLNFLKKEKIKLWTPIWKITDFVPNFQIEEIKEKIFNKKIDEFFYYQIIGLSTNPDFSLEKVYTQSVNLKDIEKNIILNNNKNNFENCLKKKKNTINFKKEKKRNDDKKNNSEKKIEKNIKKINLENKLVKEYLQKLKKKRKNLKYFLKDIKEKKLGKNSKIKYNFIYSTIIISHILDLYNGDFKDLNSEFIFEIIKINDCFKKNSKKVFLNLENVFLDLKKKFLLNGVFLKKSILEKIFVLRFFSCEIFFCFFEALDIYLENINHIFAEKNLVFEFKEIRNLQKKVIFYLSFFLNLSHQEFMELKIEIDNFILE